MWLPEQMPALKDSLEEQGLELSASSLADPMSAPLRSIVSLGFCSAAFVSPDGLIATNKELQYLLNDLYLNPQRYVRVSVFGGKEKRKLSDKELERLQRLIDAELDERAAGGE